MEDGDSANAVEILTSIVELRPNYQYAHELLDEATEAETYKAAQHHKAELAAQHLYTKQLQLQQREERRRQKNATLVMMVIATLLFFIILASCIAR